MRIIIRTFGILLVVIAFAGYLFVPNRFWSTESLTASSHGAFQAIIAMPLLCSRNYDEAHVVPALVDIAGRASWYSYRMLAAKALCRWRSPASVPLLIESIRRSVPMPPYGSNIPLWPDGPIVALGCMGALSAEAVPILSQALTLKETRISVSAKESLIQIGTPEALAAAAQFSQSPGSPK